MNPVAYAALFAWPVVAILIASWLRMPRAVIVGCLAGWMFLPEGGMDFPGPLDLSKINVTNLSMLAGLLLIEPRRVKALRPSWADLPITLLCVSSFFSSLTNGLGAYDGFAESLAKTFTWGVPWIIGRACFTSLADLRVLAVGVILGGLVYLPLCVYEARMSPQLHRMLYGFFPHAEFVQTRRFGGFRPNVFMQHGLMVGLWMCLSALTGAWMWHAGRLRSLLGVPMALLAPIQAAGAILCKSAGAIVIGAMGAGFLVVCRMTRSRVLLVALAVAPGLYVGYRVMGGPMDPIVRLVGQAPIVGQRVDSFEYRIEADTVLLRHAMKRPLFGWGGYGRHRPRNDAGEELVRTDSLWIITLGQNGIVGVVGVYGALALPLWMVARRIPARSLFSPEAAPLLILATIVSLFACDTLFNAMLSPLYTMAGGGVVATMHAMQRQKRLAAMVGPTVARSGAPGARGSDSTAEPLAAGDSSASPFDNGRHDRARPALGGSASDDPAVDQPVARRAWPGSTGRISAEISASGPHRPRRTDADRKAASADPAPLVPAGRAPTRTVGSLGIDVERFAPPASPARDDDN